MNYLPYLAAAAEGGAEGLMTSIDALTRPGFKNTEAGKVLRRLKKEGSPELLRSIALTSGAQAAAERAQIAGSLAGVGGGGFERSVAAQRLLATPGIERSATLADAAARNEAIKQQATLQYAAAKDAQPSRFGQFLKGLGMMSGAVVKGLLVRQGLDDRAAAQEATQVARQLAGIQALIATNDPARKAQGLALLDDILEALGLSPQEVEAVGRRVAPSSLAGLPGTAPARAVLQEPPPFE